LRQRVSAHLCRAAGTEDTSRYEVAPAKKFRQLEPALVVKNSITGSCQFSSNLATAVAQFTLNWSVIGNVLASWRGPV
jgi:hypothetical protein